MKKLIPAISLVALAAFAASCSCGPEAGLSPTPARAPTSGPAKPTDAEGVEEPTAAPTELPAATEPPAAFEISSAAYADGETIPNQYSCMGDNMSPPLEWAGVPAEAQSLLLFFYDPDAGFDSGASVEMGFIHWIVFNIPPSTTGYPEDMPAGDTLDDGALQGNNDFGQFVNPGDPFPGGAPIKVTGYDGPCPGDEHKYVFVLYALDATLDLPAQATPTEVLEAMEGHVIDQTELSGVYAPPK
ncbi:MAG: YbhB/YbcL family Raf kinase inhibitor-like protein [Anaerolineae bacterium]|nr:YbhB/YbcL family Raf kinase inhibitor-like protein [Anaerolineae bacterium]